MLYRAASVDACVAGCVAEGPVAAGFGLVAPLSSSSIARNASNESAGGAMPYRFAMGVTSFEKSLAGGNGYDTSIRPVRVSISSAASAGQLGKRISIVA